MRKALALWSLLGIVTAAPAFAEKKTSEEYWAGTGLSTAITLGEINLLGSDKCYRSFQGFRGCVAALNALGARMEPAARLVPNSLLEDPAFGFAAPLQRFVGLSLVAVPAETANRGTLRAEWAKEVEKRAKEEVALRSLFDFRRNASLDFVRVAQDLIPRAVKEPKYDAIVASEMISAFLKDGVDAHSRIEAVEESQAGLNDADQSFAGVGLIMQDVSGKLIVQSLVENGPAQKAGMLVNDQVLAVDGFSVVGRKSKDAADRIRGPKGSTVKIRVARNGAELEITIVRDTISQENLEARVVNDFGRTYGVIKLRTFMDKSACGKMSQKILQFESQKVDGIVLDLRQNGGGLLDQSVCMGGLFFGKKVVVKVRDLQSDRFQDILGSLPTATNLPLAVLIDAGSASASEVLSGAIQDHERGWVVGERSFGKGSVQRAEAFLGNQAIALFRTIQRFYQPKGRTNQIVGIEPNFVRPAKPNASEDDRFFLREGDYYPNALGAESAAWVETRKAQVAKVEACVATAKLAEKKFAELNGAGKNADFQLLSAQEILGCDK